MTLQTKFIEQQILLKSVNLGGIKNLIHGFFNVIEQIWNIAFKKNYQSQQLRSFLAWSTPS